MIAFHIQDVENHLLPVVFECEVGVDLNVIFDINDLDETLPAFDDKYIHNMASFLKTLCRRMGVDILLVTHNPTLVDAGDRAYRIKQNKGFCTFQRIDR